MGIFRGAKFSWIFKILRVRGKNFVVKYYRLNHTPCTREVEMASCFEVEAMDTSIKRSGKLKLANNSNPKEKLATWLHDAHVRDHVH